MDLTIKQHKYKTASLKPAEIASAVEITTSTSLGKGPSMATSNEYSQYVTRMLYSNHESSSAISFQEKNSETLQNSVINI